MNTFEVVLSNGNDERHFYVEAVDGQAAVEIAKVEWYYEFGNSIPLPQVHSVMKKNF